MSVRCSKSKTGASRITTMTDNAQQRLVATAQFNGDRAGSGAIAVLPM